MEKIIYEGIVFNEPDFHEAHIYRSKTDRAILKKILVKKPCEICGDTEVHAHHEKYADYLNVRWLCPIHHKKIHSIFNKIKREENNKIVADRLLKENPNSLFWEISHRSTSEILQELYEKYVLINA